MMRFDVYRELKRFQLLPRGAAMYMVDGERKTAVHPSATPVTTRPRPLGHQQGSKIDVSSLRRLDVLEWLISKQASELWWWRLSCSLPVVLLSKHTLKTIFVLGTCWHYPFRYFTVYEYLIDAIHARSTKRRRRKSK